MQFSVLMSIYKKENPDYFRDCIQSIVTQTVRPDEIVLVEDGKLPDELGAVVREFGEVCPQLRGIRFEENRGLGKALSDGLKECRYPVVARMDTDDIAFPDRFEKQLAAFKQSPALTLCGGQVLEFSGTTENVLRRKLVPTEHEEILRYAATRNPFNHPSVMFIKDAVLAAGGYLHMPCFEDHYLWARMLAAGARSCNLPDFILYFRAGDDVYKRRGGWDYMKASVKARWAIHKTGISGLGSFVYGAAGQIAVSLLPNEARGRFYQKVLRR